MKLRKSLPFLIIIKSIVCFVIISGSILSSIPCWSQNEKVIKNAVILGFRGVSIDNFELEFQYDKWRDVRNLDFLLLLTQ
jgi:hypothetical protein